MLPIQTHVLASRPLKTALNGANWKTPRDLDEALARDQTGPDRRANIRQNTETLARVSGYRITKPDTRAKTLDNPKILARLPGLGLV